MKISAETAYIGPQQIMEDWDVSRATAYNIIKRMNAQLKKEHPTALIIAGKVNRIWYEEACLQTSERRQRYEQEPNHNPTGNLDPK